MTRCTPWPGERVEVERERRDERLALAGLHLGDPAEVQRGAAHDLHVEVALPDRARGGLPHGGERLGEQVVEEVDARVVVGRLVEAVPELVGERAELGVGAALHLGLERGDLGRDRLEELELPAFAGVEELVEQAHEVNQLYRRTGPSDRTRPACYASHAAHGAGNRRSARSRPRSQARRRDHAGEPVRRWCDRRGPEIVLGIAMVVWVVTFSVLVYLKHDRFASVDFDMGIHDQSIWLLAHFRGLHDGPRPPGVRPPRDTRLLPLRPLLLARAAARTS